MAYLLTKTAHLVFVIAWMATVFYLPRILVNLAEAGDGDTVESRAVRARLLLMGRRLYRFGHIMFGLALLLGLALWLHFGIGGGWLHAKLLLVAGLVGYHFWCRKLLADFAAGRNRRSHRWFRVFNEAPVLVLLAVILLVIVKPF